MQRVLMIRALYAKCTYYSVLYAQSVLDLYYTALYANCLCMYCFIIILGLCIVSSYLARYVHLFSDIYAKCSYYLVIYMQSVLIFCATCAKCTYCVGPYCKASVLLSYMQMTYLFIVAALSGGTQTLQGKSGVLCGPSCSRGRVIYTRGPQPR